MAFTRESIEDVTATYTSDLDAAILRRETGPSEIGQSIARAEAILRNRTAIQLSNGSRW